MTPNRIAKQRHKQQCFQSHRRTSSTVCKPLTLGVHLAASALVSRPVEQPLSDHAHLHEPCDRLLGLHRPHCRWKDVATFFWRQQHFARRGFADTEQRLSLHRPTPLSPPSGCCPPPSMRRETETDRDKRLTAVGHMTPVSFCLTGVAAIFWVLLPT